MQKKINCIDSGEVLFNMTAATVDDLNTWIDSMMKTHEIGDYKMEVAGSSTKGDGYLGEVTFVTVKTSEQDYKLVVKSAKKSEELRKQTPIKEAYDREIFFYTKIFPIMQEFQVQKALERPFNNVPKCFSVFTEDRKEAVILQDLKAIGFEIHDRKKPMNLNHIHMVFRQYARFHALSLALNYKKPAVFKTITKNMTDILGKFVIQGQMLNNFNKNFEYIIALLKNDHKTEAVKKFEGFEKQFEKILVNFSNETTVPSVILHGDCWNNNFMFKYEGNDRTKPTDMCFLDFQLSRVASPVLDLSYFLYCCSDKQVLKDFDFILQAYHSSLGDFLTELGCNAEILFPFKKLKAHWKEYGKFGLVMSPFILKISLCDSTEAPDFAETAEKGEGFEKSFDIQIKNQEEYDSRMKDVFLHFAERFL